MVGTLGRLMQLERRIVMASSVEIKLIIIDEFAGGREP